MVDMRWFLVRMPGSAPGCFGCGAGRRLHAVAVELGFLALAVYLQRAFLADGVGPLEDPVLPGGEPSEDARGHVLAAREAQIGLQAGEGVGRHARPLLDRDTDLVAPVDVVRRRGDEAERKRLVRV